MDSTLGKLYTNRYNNITYIYYELGYRNPKRPGIVRKQTHEDRIFVWRSEKTIVHRSRIDQ